MALKALMLRKQIDQKRKALEALKAEEEKMQEREKTLETAIDEIGEEATEEEKETVQEAVKQYDQDKQEIEEQKGNLEREIQELEGELDEEEADQVTEPEQEQKENKEIRKEIKVMENRTKFFGMTIQERDAFIADDRMQAFLKEVRTAMKEKRAISGVGYLIPVNVLGLIRENIIEYSKLYKHVNVRRVSGEGRMVVEGQIPEAVWTEMCANLNELNLAFTQVEVDGYKVGGYFRICNAMLEDSDIDLATELITALGQAIGLALDKAILYGTGTKMPQGVLTGIAYGNIVSHAASVTGTDLIQAIVLDSGKAKSKYSRGAKVWVMNETTYTTLVANSLAVNAAGALVAGVNGTMPVVGGVIEVLNFIPDNVIIGGYFDLYLLAERAGTRISTSEHAFWVEDQTGFKGTARYDGKVLDNTAFVAIGINGTTPKASDVTFAEDTANTTEEEGA